MAKRIHPAISSRFPKVSKNSVYILVLTFLVAFGSALASPVCRDLFYTLGLNQNTDLPESAFVIALGHDSEALPLQLFANHVERYLHRHVVTYRQLADAHYISQTGRWWEELPIPRVTATVEEAIRHAVALYPNRQIIAFNLDSYDPTELFAPDGTEIWSYTNFEVDLLLRHETLFRATRWYRDGHELSEREAVNFWAKARAMLQSSRHSIGYGP